VELGEVEKLPGTSVGERSVEGVALLLAAALAVCAPVKEAVEEDELVPERAAEEEDVGEE
jgi:hypothetical protein